MRGGDGAAEDAGRRIVAVPPKGTVLNTENTNLAPLSGMHASFLHTCRW